jgi:hypothetical protein
VAGLTADPEAVPLAVERVAGRIEIALEASGVAFDAHEVGVLAGLAPVQRILEIHALTGIEVKPAVFLGIPRHTERLQTTFADVDQVLLQRCNAEGVGDFEVSVLAIDTRRIDRNWSSLRENRVVSFSALKVTLLKSPSTVSAFAGCIANW